MSIIYNGYLIRVTGNKWSHKKQWFTVYIKAVVPRTYGWLRLAQFDNEADAKAWIDAL